MVAIKSAMINPSWLRSSSGFQHIIIDSRQLMNQELYHNALNRFPRLRDFCNNAPFHATIAVVYKIVATFLNTSIIFFDDHSRNKTIIHHLSKHNPIWFTMQTPPEMLTTFTSYLSRKHKSEGNYELDNPSPEFIMDNTLGTLLSTVSTPNKDRACSFWKLCQVGNLFHS